MDRSERTEDSTLALRGRALRLGDRVELGRMDRFESELDAYAQLLGQQRRLSFLWHVPLERAHLAALGGRFDEAEQLAAEVLAAGRRVAENEPELGAHLGVSVRTGGFCSYSPDPASGVTWTL